VLKHAGHYDVRLNFQTARSEVKLKQ